MPFAAKSLADALLDHVEPDTNGGCWLWTGHRDKGGYCIVFRGKARLLAHREAYRLWGPAGADVDQLVLERSCGVEACIRPEHIRPKVTRAGAPARPATGRPAAGETTLQRLWRGLDRSGPCWLWTGKVEPHGYVHIMSGGHQVQGHRLMYESLVGPIPDGAIVRHRCDTPACCNPDHLEVGTQADNVADMMARGRWSNGRGSGF
jgi:hypothetical protein